MNLKKMSPKDKIVLALDVDNVNQAKSLVAELKEYVGVYKVGKQLFTAAGPEIVNIITKNGCKVFLDLKYHDIPTTVSKAAEEAVKLGVFILDIHASGGYEMMRSCVESVKNKSEELGKEKPMILAVTVLTSIDDVALNNDLNVPGKVQEQVVHLAKLAKKAGLDGVVASPNEVHAIKQACGEDFVILTPGIRPEWAAANDQKRITTPKQAIQNGSTFIVIGRPITKAPNPVEAAKKILDEISS